MLPIVLQFSLSEVDESGKVLRRTQESIPDISSAAMAVRQKSKTSVSIEFLPV